jgi:hypothetical protein
MHHHQILPLAQFVGPSAANFPQSGYDCERLAGLALSGPDVPTPELTCASYYDHRLASIRLCVFRTSITAHYKRLTESSQVITLLFIALCYRL